MEKLLCIFIMLFMFYTIIPVSFASDSPKADGKAKIFVLRRKPSFLSTILPIYINGLLITSLNGNHYIYFEANPGKVVVAFNGGFGVGTYVDFGFGTLSGETYLSRLSISSAASSTDTGLLINNSLTIPQAISQ